VRGAGTGDLRQVPGRALRRRGRDLCPSTAARLRLDPPWGRLFLRRAEREERTMAAEVPITAWRTVRAFTLGSGPLKRGSDRVQFTARLVLLLVVLVSVPVALSVGTVVHERLQAVAQEQPAGPTRVTAVAPEGPPSLTDARPGPGRPGTALWWTAPDRGPCRRGSRFRPEHAPGTRSARGRPTTVARPPRP
jgi:hypothetical protein